jgi:hypothetical protein
MQRIVNLTPRSSALSNQGLVYNAKHCKPYPEAQANLREENKRMGSLALPGIKETKRNRILILFFPWKKKNE